MFKQVLNLAKMLKILINNSQTIFGKQIGVCRQKAPEKVAGLRATKFLSQSYRQVVVTALD